MSCYTGKCICRFAGIYGVLLVHHTPIMVTASQFTAEEVYLVFPFLLILHVNTILLYIKACHIFYTNFYLNVVFMTQKKN